jgi:hypothetical protein
MGWEEKTTALEGGKLKGLFIEQRDGRGNPIN